MIDSKEKKITAVALAVGKYKPALAVSFLSCALSLPTAFMGASEALGEINENELNTQPTEIEIINSLPPSASIVPKLSPPGSQNPQWSLPAHEYFIAAIPGRAYEYKVCEHAPVFAEKSKVNCDLYSKSLMDYWDQLRLVF